MSQDHFELTLRRFFFLKFRLEFLPWKSQCYQDDEEKNVKSLPVFQSEINDSFNNAAYVTRSITFITFWNSFFCLCWRKYVENLLLLVADVTRKKIVKWNKMKYLLIFRRLFLDQGFAFLLNATRSLLGAILNQRIGVYTILLLIIFVLGFSVLAVFFR